MLSLLSSLINNKVQVLLFIFFFHDDILDLKADIFRSNSKFVIRDVFVEAHYFFYYNRLKGNFNLYTFFIRTAHS